MFAEIRKSNRSDKKHEISSKSNNAKEHQTLTKQESHTIEEPVVETDAVRHQPSLELVCESGPLEGKRFAIIDNALISRSPITVATVEEQSLSTPHLFISWWEDGVEIRDLNSKLGTMINGSNLGSTREIVPIGSQMILGKTVTANVGRAYLQINERSYITDFASIIVE